MNQIKDIAKGKKWILTWEYEDLKQHNLSIDDSN